MDVIKIFAASILWYPLFLVPALIGFVPFGFIHKREKRFMKSDFLALTLPWLVWLFLMAIFSTGKKSLSNLVEAFMVGGFVAILYIALSIALRNKQVNRKLGNQVICLLACIASFLIYYFTPGLPE